MDCHEAAGLFGPELPRQRVTVGERIKKADEVKKEGGDLLRGMLVDRPRC
jgi:hypothetical protein